MTNNNNAGKPNPALIHFMQNNINSSSEKQQQQQMNMSHSERMQGIGMSSSRNKLVEHASKQNIGNPMRANSVVKHSLATQRYEQKKSSSKLGLHTSDIRGSV